MPPARIHPTALLSQEAIIADDVTIGPFSIVEGPAILKKGVTLESHVVIKGHTEIGENSRISSFCHLGGAPQHLGAEGRETKLSIGNNATIREYCVIHRGSESDDGLTHIGEDLLMMCHSHIGHDCKLGDGVRIVVGSMIGGHVKIGSYSFIGAQCAIEPFIRLGAYCRTGTSITIKNRDMLPFSATKGDGFSVNYDGLAFHKFSRERIRNIRKWFEILNDEKKLMHEKLEKLMPVLEGAGEDAQRLKDFLTTPSKRGYTACLEEK